MSPLPLFRQAYYDVAPLFPPFLVNSTLSCLALPLKRAAVEGVAMQLPADDVARPSASLVRHESVINILLETLFDPTQRSPSEDVKTG